MGYLVESFVNALAGILSGETGIQSVVGEPTYIADSESRGMTGIGIRKQALSADTNEAGATKQPEIAVYCDKLKNTLREKFRSFSGTAQLVVDVRATGDTVDGTGTSLQKYTEGVLQVLHGNRGDWGGGMFFSGAYEVSFQPAKKGGKNYVQSARVILSVDYSMQ